MNINLEKYIKNKTIIIGTNTVIKNILNLESVFIARDTDNFLKSKIIDVCNKNNIKYYEQLTKNVLGKICQIEVDCAIIGIYKKEFNADNKSNNKKW